MIKQIVFTSFILLALTLAFSVDSVMAIRVFYDDFEDKAFTENAWTQGAEPFDWEISNDYNNTPGGVECLKIFAEDMEVWGDMWYMFETPLKPVHVRVWFYERGWQNNIKVDQQYILIGDDNHASDFAQIGQTGNSDYDGHYCIYTRNPDAFHVSQSSSEEERWVRMEFILTEDGTAKILVDGIEEFVFPQKWESLDRVGFGVYARDNRGGVTEGYWDDLEIFDTEDAPPLSVTPKSKLATTWGLLKK